MNFLEHMGLDGNHKKVRGYHEDPYWNLPIHEGFSPIEGDWHGNALYRSQFETDTLPGYSREFKITDEEINRGMLEDANDFPIKIKRAGANEYWVYAFKSIAEEDPVIEQWINHYTYSSKKKAA